MIKNLFGSLLLVCFLFFNSVAQPSLCNGANPFCTGITYNFPATTSVGNTLTAQPGVDYGCLSSTPNPVWYYLKVATNGSIVLNIAGANSGDDIDFACWGPFSSPTGGCTAGLTNNCSGSLFGCTDNTQLFGGTTYPSGNMVDCSYDPQATEVCTIPNAVAGQYYMVLITNFGNNATNIIFNQTNAGSGGAGSTDCSIVLNNACNITTVTALPSGCNASNNTYSVTGSITFTNAPTTGSLVVATACGGQQVFTAPFVSPLNYLFTGLISNGVTCSVSAAFSASTACQKTITFSAPVSCTVSSTSCNIISLIANPSACDASTNTYSVTGSITFTNAPTTGSLVVATACGGQQIFTAPFVSPLNYSFTGSTSNGATCSVSAVFSASTACQKTITFLAPTSCTVSSTSCNIVSLIANPSACDASTNTYSLTGSITFANAPTTGSLIVATACGGQQIFTAPFVSPLTYSFIGLSSNGATCSVSAAFSASTACQKTISYVASAPCTTCVISATNNSPICEGNTLELTTPLANAISYAWSGPFGFSASTPSISINAAQISMNGVYTLLATSSNSSICTATTLVQVEKLPTVDYQLSMPSQQGDFSISIFSDTTNATIFYWATNNDTIKTKQFTYDYKDAGTFQLCYYAENKLGCSIYNCESITLKSDWLFYIPNSFSPNGDGINDLFTGVGLAINEYELKVFNRWGTMVYNTLDMAKGWNGKVKASDNDAPQDVYTWKVTLKDIYNKKHEYVGHVTLLR